jgi:hypothetical protein
MVVGSKEWRSASRPAISRRSAERTCACSMERDVTADGGGRAGGRARRGMITRCGAALQRLESSCTPCSVRVGRGCSGKGLGPERDNRQPTSRHGSADTGHHARAVLRHPGPLRLVRAAVPHPTRRGSHRMRASPSRTARRPTMEQERSGGRQSGLWLGLSRGPGSGKRHVPCDASGAGRAKYLVA